MKVLVVGNAYSVHIYNFINDFLLNNADKIVVWDLSLEVDKEIKENMDSFYEDNDITMIQRETGCQDAFSDLNSGFYKIKKIGAFDVCHLHFLGYATVTIGLLVRKICKRLICSYWGSDWLRADDSQKHYQRYLLEVSDYIVTGSKQIYGQVNEYYDMHFDGKIEYIRFKTPVIEAIRMIDSNASMKKKFKEKWLIATDKIIVTCGYNGSRAQEHKSIIEAIAKLPITYKNKLYIVIPMTCGSELGYGCEIKQILENTGIEFIIMENFLSIMEVALLRLTTDIFINMQPTDAYSHTIREYTYCNKIIINGEWIDYSELEKKGAYFMKVDDISKLTNVLQEIMDNLDAVKKMFTGNRDVAEKFQIDDEDDELWKKIYEGNNIKNDNDNGSLQMSLFEDIKNKVDKWAEKNRYKDIGIYGVGILGGIAYRSLIESVGIDHIYAFDRNTRHVEWYSDLIFKPEEMKRKQMDAVIITPSNGMKKIKEDYRGKVSCPVLTYVEWLEQLEKVN